MKLEHVGGLADILRRNRVRFVIVGGAAVLRSFPSESRDVDALVMTRDYERATEQLDKDPGVVSFTNEGDEMAGGHFLSQGALIRFDLLNPEAFSGERNGDDFFDYVVRWRSTATEVGRVASVPLVWYMRLVIDNENWAIQVPKILRDLRAGAPVALFAEVRRVARRFGVLGRVEPRIEFVRDAAMRAGLLPYGPRRAVGQLR